MKRLVRILFLGICPFLLLASSQLSYAEDAGNAKEVTAEAVYRMGDSDTPAKAEEQALLRAKRNALEQISSLTLTADSIAALPPEVFAVTVLDKKKAMNGDAIECWVKIQAVIYPDKLKAALTQTNSIWGGPAEYYQELVTYADGKEAYREKHWIKNNWKRREVLVGSVVTITKYEKNNKVLTYTYWTLGNNKYHEETNQKMEIVEEILGTEKIGDVAVQKIREITTISGSKYVCLKWVDPTTKLTLKTQEEQNGTTYVTVYQNTKIGPQDPALFEIPKGYVRCASAEEVFRTENTAPEPDPFSDLFNTILQNQVDKAIDKVKIK